MKAVTALGCFLPLLYKVHAKIVGVSPVNQSLYKPNDQNKWKCLTNPDIEIDFSQINDGICDCPDGSDEPGTSACSDTLESRLFYCENNGFKPRYIRGSLVNDGVCDCCDCSDENLTESRNICEELSNSFNRIVETEMKKYKIGQNKLLELLEEFHVPSDNYSGDQVGDSEIEIIKIDIESLNGELESIKELLKKNKDHFYSKLEIDNPILLDFEKINFNYLNDEIGIMYETIESVSRAYQSLIQILKDLWLSYAESMNDRVVNENMDKFDKLIRRPEMEKIVADGDVDVEQRDQLFEYLNEELPAIFWDRVSEFPASYSVRKVKFIEALINGKVDYTVTLKKYIKEFSSLLDEISENYNVNFQDSGVLTAVNDYKNYLSKFTDIIGDTRFTVSKEFKNEFTKLMKVIKEDVPKLIPEDKDDTLDDGSGNNLWNYLTNEVYGTLSTDLESLKQQIVSYETRIKNIESSLKEKTAEYSLLKKIEEQEEITVNENGLSKEDRILLKQVTDLVEKMDENTGSISQVLDNYRYEISLNPLLPGFIQQHEDKEHGNNVRIGYLTQIYFDKKINFSKFSDYIKMEWSEDDIISHLFSDKKTIGEREYLFGNLEGVNNGLIFEFTGGEKCWNGPQRSAKLFIKCSENFEIQNVYETTKCNYMIDASGPIGCNLNFEFNE